MPAMYEAMRDNFEKKGMGEKDAKTKAAKIYVAKGKGGDRHSRAMALAKDRKGPRRKPAPRFKAPSDYDGDE